ncbi:hypothetical protein BBO_00056 [Beauveria brongniartii RCEF 3172]|uniref:Uncharacterized protein n=1 Tax=Beauveria brongniartii RCEF 3172 TaxID=1081107 RepID=A0A162I4J7_9HYPO|nr:hypothetical protein BBO_00056 [Beauveria brongniartii RCEF 3172]
MLHSKWPRLRSAATFCCPRGTRLYSSRGGDDRTLPDRPNFTVAPRGRTRTNDRRNKWNDWTPRPNPAVQQRQQAQRNLRRKLVEGKLSPARQKEVAAALEGLDPEQFAAAGFDGLKSTNGERAADTRRAGDGGQWSLLKRRPGSLELEDDIRDEQDLEEGETTNASAEKWPLLKRRGRSYEYMDLAGTPLNDSTDVVAEPTDDSTGITNLMAATSEALAKKDALAVSKSYTMLRIDGLSTSVHASDFYRIADNDLSKWNQSIKQVQQVRDRTTLDPTGTYNLTFSSALAATAYALRFQRLCDLAQVRARSRTGLWRSELPPGLVPDDVTQDDLEAELAGLTFTPGVQPVTLTHRRVAAAPVGEKIRSLVANDGLGERPPVVLLDVAPAAPLDRVRSAMRQYGGGDTEAEQLRAHPLAADLYAQLQRLTVQIGAIGQATDGNEEQDEHVYEEQDEGVLEWNKWDSDRKQNEAAEKKRHATLRKREGLRRVVRHMESAALRRFVVAFRDVSEAQRFHRQWNARWLGGQHVPPPAGAPRHFVRTEVVDY